MAVKLIFDQVKEQYNQITLVKLVEIILFFTFFNKYLVF